MKLLSAIGLACAACVAVPLAASPASAGSGNQVYIEQSSTASGIGNSLYVDQSSATDSGVGGFSKLPDLDTLDSPFTGDARTLLSGAASASTPARQTGGNNQASITITGLDGLASLDQNNDAPSDANSLNDASIVLSGKGSFGGVSQNGHGNTANLTVSGLNSAGGILQNGSGNTGAVEVSGGGTGLLIQNGSNNDNSLTGVGRSNSVITYVVNGNSLVNAAAANVVTNSAAVTITQTSAFSQ